MVLVVHLYVLEILMLLVFHVIAVNLRYQSTENLRKKNNSKFKLQNHNYDCKLKLHDKLTQLNNVTKLHRLKPLDQQRIQIKKKKQRKMSTLYHHTKPQL